MSETHKSRYEQLHQNRMESKPSGQPDKSGVTLVFNGNGVRDIPDFFLQLGELVNGPGGYYGCCLDSLDDCLCGDFGLRPPFTIIISGWSKLCKSMGGNSLKSWWEADRQRADAEGYDFDEVGIPDSVREPGYKESYLHYILEVFHQRGVTVVITST